MWPETHVQPEVLKSRIFEVRSALGDRPKTPRFIETLPRRGYRFIAPIHDGPAVASVLPAPPAHGHLVGRAGVLETLRACLHRAVHGQRQLVFVTGEPGIGKTALVDAFQQQVTVDVPGLRLARGQCLEGYGGMEAYYPLLEALGALCREAGGAASIELLATHAPTWLVQFPAFMTRAHRDTLQRELQGATRERMLRELAELLEVLTAARPLLLVLEDLQWVDPATVDLLAALARRRAPAQLLVVGTYRPVDLAMAQHPLRALTQELRVHQLCHELAVEPLSEADVAAYLAAAAAGAPLPEGLAGLVSRHSEGNPLFMRAVLDHLTQQGLLAREPDGWQLRVPIAAMTVGVPESVRQMLDAQMERLRPEEQRLLEVASVAGTVFTASVCAAAADQAPEDVEALCETLARQQHLVRTSGPPQVLPDGSLAPRYAFVHALYREVCYGRQAPGRRATLHRRLGERMEVVFATQLHDVAAELAYHFEAGAAWARAITYLRVVADTAGQRYAYREAATTLQHALALVPHLPETPARTQHALTLHLALGAALLMTTGHAAPEVEHTYTQARALCQQMDATPELVPALFDLWRFYIARPQLQIARELGETLLGLAQPADDPALAVLAHYAMGSTWLRLGALPAARRQLEAGIARATPDPHRAPGGRMVHELGVACRVNAAQTLWLLGYPEQALVRLQEALAGAHALSHPFSRAYVWCWAAVVAQFCRDVLAVHAHAEAAGMVATAHGLLRTLTPGTWGKMRAAGVVATMQGFPLWAAMGRILHGWALAMQGQGAEGLAQVCQGSPPCRRPGQRCSSPICAPCSRTSRPTWATPPTASRH